MFQLDHLEETTVWMNPKRQKKNKIQNYTFHNKSLIVPNWYQNNEQKPSNPADPILVN